MYVFPDTTVLCNFSAAGALDTFIAYAGHRGRVVEAVAYEIGRSAEYELGLQGLDVDAVFGSPIRIESESDVAAVEIVRTAVFGGSKREPLRHLGESQSIHVVATFPEFSGSVWVTDDHEAHTYAQRRGIVTRDTVDVCADLVARHELTADEAFDLLQRMLDTGRSLLKVPLSAAELSP